MFTATRVNLEFAVNCMYIFLDFCQHLDTVEARIPNEPMLDEVFE